MGSLAGPLSGPWRSAPDGSVEGLTSGDRIQVWSPEQHAYDASLDGVVAGYAGHPVKASLGFCGRTERWSIQVWCDDGVLREVDLARVMRVRGGIGG